MTNMKTVFAIVEANYPADGNDQTFVDLYETKDLALEQMAEEVEECIEQNEAEIVSGSVEEGFVKLRDGMDNVYEFEVEEKQIRNKGWKNR